MAHRGEGILGVAGIRGGWITTIRRNTTPHIVGEVGFRPPSWVVWMMDKGDRDPSAKERY